MRMVPIQFGPNRPPGVDSEMRASTRGRLRRVLHFAGFALLARFSLYLRSTRFRVDVKRELLIFTRGAA